MQHRAPDAGITEAVSQHKLARVEALEQKHSDGADICGYESISSDEKAVEAAFRALHPSSAKCVAAATSKLI